MIGNGNTLTKYPQTEEVTPPLENAVFMEHLTTLELEVLELIGYGYTVPEISTMLNKSAYTVRDTRQRIKEKCNLERRYDFVFAAIRLGLMS